MCNQKVRNKISLYQNIPNGIFIGSERIITSQNNNKSYSRLIQKSALLTILLLLIANFSFGQTTYYSRQTGNWGTAATWSTTSHAGGAAATYPVAGDIVYIGAQTVTVAANAASASITFDVTGGILTVNNGITLNVSGAITLNNLANANIAATIAGNGSLIAGSINVGNGTAATTNNTTRTHTINSTVNNLTVSGNLTINSYFVNNNRVRNGVFNQTSGTVTVNGSVVTANANGGNTSTLTLGNSNPTLILGGTTPFTISGTGTSTITLNGTGATVEYSRLSGGQAIRTSTYTNLKLDNTSGTNTAGGAITVNGAFTTTGGGTFSTANNLTLTGTTTCGGTINATAGTASYAASALNIISGTYFNLTLSGAVTYTQCNAVTVSNTLAFSTTGAILNTAYDLSLSGSTITNPTYGTINASAGTVYYSYAGIQNILAGIYYNLDIYDGNFTKTIQGAVTINNILSWDMGNIALSTFNFTLAPTATITSSNVFSGTHMFVCNGLATAGSLVRQSNSAVGLAIEYPVGTGTNYSPMNITSLSATVTSPASISVNTVPTYYSAGGAGSTDLNRYWVVDSTNLADVSADITFTYVDADVAGTESDYKGALYPISSWIYYDFVNTGANTFTTGSTPNLGGTWTARRPAATFFSYQSGNWNAGSTWTFDASGTIDNNLADLTPSATDNVVIINGDVVTVTNNNNTVYQLEIQEGAILDVAGSNNQNYGAISGKGRLRSTSGALPTGVYTLFTQSGGGTIELYGNITGSPDLSISTFNNLEMNGNTNQKIYFVNTPTQINGDILVKGGELDINHNGSTSLSVTVEGNITVKSGCTLSLGAGGANHDLYVKGDVENEGTIKLTSATGYTYDSDPTASVTLTFSNTTKNQSFNCNGPTTLDKLVVDKGTDDTYMLDLNSNTTGNFLLYGRNDQNATNTNSPGSVLNNKALNVNAGTLRLGSNITIPRLLTANAWPYNNYFVIDQDATIILDGSTINVTEDITDISSIIIYGKLKVLGSSTFSSNGGQGIILREYGVLDIDGTASAPTINTTVFRTSSRLELGTHRGTFIMKGGILNISGNNYADTHPAFALPFGDNTFQMSGGTINITNSTYHVDGGGNGGVNWSWLVCANESNISVTGGTININATNRNAYINSTAPFYILNFTGNATYTNEIQSITDQYDGGNLVVPAAPLRKLVVLNNLSISANARFITNDQNVTVGGNFTINASGTYTPGDNTTTFNGYGLQNFSNAGTITSGLYNLTLTNSSLLTITNNLTVRNNLEINSENTLRDVGHTINVAGRVTNSGKHESVIGGSIILNGTGDQVITGDGDGIFGNISLNKSSGTTVQSANISITGDLRLANTAAVLNIGSNKLALSTTSGIYDELTGTNTGFSSSKMIQTSGIQSDLGVEKAFTVIGTTIFPIGVSGKYTPARLEMDAAPTAWGTVTFNPVNSTHPLATSTNILKYYWNVRRTEMSGFTSGNLRLKFYYTDADISGDEGQYKPASYYPTTWTLVDNTNKVSDASNEILFDAIDQPRGHYTAGYSDAFGTVQTFYSRQTGNWSDLSGTEYTSWTNDPVGNAPATSLPSESSPVVIRSGHTITIPAGDNNKRVGSLEIQGNAILDVTTSTGHFFGLIYQTTVSGTGTLRISSSAATAEFPGGDFGEFLGSNGGTVEYYTTGGQDFTMPGGSLTTTSLLNESFEGGTFPPVNWSMVSGPNDSPNWWNPNTDWERTTTQSHTGSASTRHIEAYSGFWGYGTQDDILICPPLNFSDQASYELTFWRYNADPTNYYYQGVWISTSNNQYASFVPLVELGQGSAGWVKHTLDLSSYAGNGTVYIAFSYKSRDGNTDDIYIDDVAVSKSVGNAGYHHLIVNPEDLRTITLPGINVSVSGNFTVKGAGTTATSNTLSNVVTVNGQTSIDETGTLRIDNNTRQTFTLNNSFNITNGASLEVNTVGTAARAHRINLYGNVINNGSINLNPGSSKYADVYFLGATNETFSGTGTTANLNRVYVDKGTSQTPYVDITADAFDMNSNLEQALTITNGTIRFSGTSLSPIITTNSSFTIPATGCLSINGSTVTVGSSATDAADIYLSGKLEVMAGTMNIGAAANNNHNDIEYATAGSPEISVSGGTLNVNGQIRRSTTIATGNLTYRQSGGNVYIYGKNRDANQIKRALLEVLNSGSFYSSGNGNLYLAQGVTSTEAGNTFGELYLNPTTYSVTGGTIHTGTSTTAAATNYFNLYLGGPIWNLTVNGETNLKNAVLKTFPAVIKGNLIIDGPASSVFYTNGLDLTIGGNLISRSGNKFTSFDRKNNNQKTMFNGSSQIVYKDPIYTTPGGALYFGKVTVDQTTGGTLTVENNELWITNDLTLNRGSLIQNNSSNIMITKDLYINNSFICTANSLSKLTFYNNSVVQNIYSDGTGSLARIVLFHATGVNLHGNLTISKSLEFPISGAAGKLSIGNYLLTFGPNATIGTGAAAPSATRFIVTNGALSDLGVKKEFSVAGSFTFPIGVGSEGGKYTPVTMNVTNTGGAAGSITVKPVDAPHPMRTNALNDELQYFWSVSSTGFGATPTVSHTYTYSDLDIVGTETTYVNARLFDYTWYKQTEVVDFANNQIKFTGVNYINGDYTAGEVTNWGTVHKYYSVGPTGNWSNAGSWLLDSPTGPPAATAPNGNPVFIQAGHTITTNQDGAYAGSVDIAATATLDLGSKVGHNIGYISGGGTIHIDATGGGSFIFPGGDPSSFMNTTGSTVHYSGAGTIPSNITTYQNILFSGNNTKTIPATDITVLGNLTISAGNLDNTINNRLITLYGNWISSVSGGYKSGTGKVTLTGGNAQSITSTGGENFYNFEVNKTTGTIATLNSVVNINRLFTLTSGIVNTETNLLTMTWDDPNALSGGSTTAYVDGPLRKFVRNSSTFTFPVGDAGRYGPVYIFGTTSTGNQYWTGRYYNVPPSNQTSLDPPLQLVSNNEYWEVTGVNGTKANVRIRWDNQSQIIPATALGREKLRVAQYTTTWTKVGETVVDGGQTSGTIATSTAINHTGTAIQFTIGVEQTASAQITGTNAAKCDDGTVMTVTYVIAGSAPLSLTYQINGVDVTPSLPGLSEGIHTIDFTYNQLYAISGAGDYVITIKEVLDKNSIYGVVLAGSATLTLYETPNPIISGATTVMISTSNDYSVTNTVGNTYTWSVIATTGGASATLTNENTSTVTATWGATEGTVTLQLVETIPAHSCSRTVTYLVTVRDWPVIVGNFNVCANSTEGYHTKVVAGHTYIWIVVGGTIQSGAGTDNITVLWSTETAGTITLQQGTSAPYTEVSQNVTINSAPTATLNVDGSSSICDNETVTLLLSRSGAGSFYTFYLQKDGADYMSFDQSTATTNPYSYTTENLIWIAGTPGDDYSFRLRIVNNTTGCSSIWDEEIITVFKIPETGPEYHIPNDHSF